MKPAAPPPGLDRSMEPPVRDVTNDADRWIPESPTWLEVVALAFAVTVVVDAVIVGATALAIVAFATWGPS